MFDKRLDTAEVRDEVEHLQFFDERAGYGPVTVEFEGDDASVVLHLPGREIVLRVAFEPRVVDRSDRVVVGQKLGDARHISLVEHHPRGERREVAEDEIAIERREWCPDQVYEHELGERVGIPIEPAVDELVSDETEE